MEKIYKGEIQRLLPIFQAMADGRIIQVSENGNDWIDIDGEEEGLFLDTIIDNPQCYRIKTEPKYRPFKNAEECWQEMLKHQPFAWVKEKHSDRYSLITEVNRLSIKVKEGCLFTDGVKYYTFADGTPFGVKVEE